MNDDSIYSLVATKWTSNSNNESYFCKILFFIKLNLNIYILNRNYFFFEYLTSSSTASLLRIHKETNPIQTNFSIAEQLSWLKKSSMKLIFSLTFIWKNSLHQILPEKYLSNEPKLPLLFTYILKSNRRNWYPQKNRFQLCYLTHMVWCNIHALNRISSLSIPYQPSRSPHSF